MTALLTKDQACERLQISRRTLDRLIAERRIGYRKLGASVRFSESDIDEFVASAHIAAVPVSRRRSGLGPVSLLAAALPADSHGSAAVVESTGNRAAGPVDTDDVLGEVHAVTVATSGAPRRPAAPTTRRRPAARTAGPHEHAG